MNKMKETLVITTYNFRRWKRNPRVALTFVLAFVLCLMLSDKVDTFARNYGTTLQIVEMFVWTFGDTNSIMISSLLLVFLFADMPFVSTATPFILYRTNRSTWIAGQILYVVLTTVVYTVFLFCVTCMISAPRSFVGNQWSETAAMIGYSGVGQKIAVPASAKAMESASPFYCAAVVFLLMTLYSLMAAIIMMFLNLGKKDYMGIAGIFGLNIYGMFLNPQIFMELFHIPETLAFKANVWVGWLSPLNHATFYMHNFGYDYLPKIWMSVAIFLLLIVLGLLLVKRRIGSYEFGFQQTEEI